jgi:all-trans-retinol 13,14-reductase
MSKSKVVVIGSGMAGLYAGAYLAREGFSVTVLEKEPTPGGLLASFCRQGNWFDTGVHYLGSLSRGQTLWRYFQALDLFPLCQFDAMDNEGFEEYRFPGFAFSVPQGWDAFIQSLEAAFPLEKEGIRACAAEWRRLASQFPLYNLSREFAPGQEAEVLSNPLALQPLAGYLQERFRDPRLRAVLSANNALYGIAPDECPLYIHALITDSFLSGAWRVHGPSRVLVQALATRLREAGGELRCNARIQRLASENQRVRAAVLDSGEEIAADWFISTVHPKAMLGFMEPHTLRPVYRQRISDLEETISAFGLSLTLRGQGVPTPRRNYFLHRDLDTSAVYHRFKTSDPFDPATVFVSPMESSPGFARTLSIMCPMAYSAWAPWESSLRGARPEGYLRAKEQMALSLIARLEELWPGVGARVEVWEGATPLTFRDYTGTWEGSAYGIKKSVAHLREATLSVRTRLENLLLAGQSVVLPGIVGATTSAAAAVGNILGYAELLHKLGRL